MLQIQHIKKEYRTGSLVQKALDDVSLNLRDNEFVAILGPSGSGKTTLLNIIGGLDRYDSGDLIINGISTRQYKDRDWDSYRNHTIGFVFQSYNLIPHQTILANVELALTISGIGKAERRRRAQAALDQVGLGNQVQKRPNQLSGGQMQRVAIARALVNDPDILLADEPTGALDSETSVQVMELLKEVARDRLVVMVTHNPELAEQYATRIVNLRDGKIVSDTLPFLLNAAAMAPPVHKNLGKASMSFLTALALSFNNLRTKKARTLLTAFAGSIGIIGIALILALSTGVNDYIQYIEEDTLAEYPLQITSSGFNLTSLMTSGSSLTATGDTPSEEGTVSVVSVVTSMFSSLDSNDLSSLKAYFDSGTSGIEPYVNSIEYIYDVTPQIYTLSEEGEARQVNPDSSFSSMGLGSSVSSSSIMSSMMSTDVFYQLPNNEKLFENQYTVVAGRWPESYNECIIVLTSSGGMSDFLLYTLGLRDALELEEMVQQFIDGETVTTPEDMGTYTYEDLLQVTFRLVHAADCYQYDTEYAVWVDKTDDSNYMQTLVENGELLTIVGVVQANETSSSAILSSGIYYTQALIEHLVDYAAGTEIVQSQMAQPSINVLTGEKFGSDSGSDLDMGNLFQIDTDALEALFQFDTSDLEDALAGSFDFSDGLTLDTDSLGDLGSLDISTPDMSLGSIDLTSLLSGININLDAEDLSTLVSDLISNYKSYVAEHPEADYSNLASDFGSYLTSDAASSILSDHVQELLDGITTPSVDTSDLQSLITEILTGYLSYAEALGYTDATQLASSLQEYLNTGAAQDLMNQWIADNVQMDLDIDISDDWLSDVASDLSSGYVTYAQENGLADPSKIGEYFAEYLSSDATQATILTFVASALDTSGIEEQISSTLSSYMAQIMGAYGSALSSAISEQLSSIMTELSEQLANSITEAMTSSLSGLGDTLSEAMSLDADSLENAFQVTMDSAALTELMLSLSTSSTSTYDNNLLNMGWIDFNSPSEIDIYPIDFDSKAAVVDILDDYNARMEASGQDEKVITYTDLVGTLMGSVTEIIDIISYVLIAFVAISLVVSSIMIGVITYISVLERRKEIGILRAIGASKGNISQVFNAETCIIGLCAGLLGILISLLALIPGNMLIHYLAGSNNVNAVLPFLPAVILVLLSVVLTLIGGLIPSRKAAKSDPVIALRTD